MNTKLKIPTLKIDDPPLIKFLKLTRKTLLPVKHYVFKEHG